MGRFNLEDYEPVEDRLARFWNDHPTGSVTTQLVARDNGEWVFRAEVFRDEADPRPAGVGYAHEVDGQGNVNRTNACENCETSAVGRALAQAGYAPKGARPSREEMVKASEPGWEPVPDDVVAATVREAEAKGLDKSALWAALHQLAGEHGLPAPSGWRKVHPDLFDRLGGWLDTQPSTKTINEDVPF